VFLTFQHQKMTFTIIIMTTVMVLTLFAPFGVYYGVKLARKKDFTAHRKLQTITFILCGLGVLALEVLIRYSGGSGSLASNSTYYGTPFFTITLISHIIAAVLTYIMWLIFIIVSARKHQKSLPGKFSKMHKRGGMIIFGGLIYTAVTALVIYLMTLNLV